MSSSTTGPGGSVEPIEMRLLLSKQFLDASRHGKRQHVQLVRPSVRERVCRPTWHPQERACLQDHALVAELRLDDTRDDEEGLVDLVVHVQNRS